MEKRDPVNPGSLYLRKDGKKTLLAVMSCKNASARLNMEFNEKTCLPSKRCSISCFCVIKHAINFSNYDDL